MIQESDIGFKFLIR